ncbi:hypothetical protein VTK73DRAFT_1673 [Phialemonium thermophilum]|uniref:Post-SET domain-containing protein n=1 Tax=Phialemonium thermophilum TaxID=223376 RepID=A0ABR3X955_9PEZI
MSSSTCYCANYYGSVNCRNVVTRFGDRCKLCLALRSGASLSEGLLPEEQLWPSAPRSGRSGRASKRSNASDSGDTGTTEGRSSGPRRPL